MQQTFSLNISAILEILYRFQDLGGSTESNGSSLAEGIAIHSRIQKKFKSTSLQVTTEKPCCMNFAHRGMAFQISGRIDLYVKTPHQHEYIVEIKSCQSPAAAAKSIATNPNHPHLLQAALYSLLLNVSEFQSTNILLPNQTQNAYLLYASTTSSQVRWVQVETAQDQTLSKLRELLDVWLNENWLQKQRKRISNKLAESISFPYPIVRSPQAKLMNTLQSWIGTPGPILVQAPTGSGKTIASLFPALRRALLSCDTIVFCTSKNSQKIAATKTLREFRAQGSNPAPRFASVPSAVVLQSKENLCLQKEHLVCQAKYCRFADRYYEKVRKLRLLKFAHRGTVFDHQTLKKIGQHYEVCPFELSLDLALQVQVVVCDFNHVVSPRAQIKRFFRESSKRAKVQLIVDEAHNFPTRTREEFSPALQQSEISGAIYFPAKNFLQKWNAVFVSLCEFLLERNRTSANSVAVDLWVDEETKGKFSQSMFELSAHYSRYAEKIESVAFNDIALKFFQNFGAFCQLLEHQEFGRASPYSLLYTNENGLQQIKIFCKDAAKILGDLLSPMPSPIFMSATLNPAEYYARKLGCADQPKYKFIDVPSAFPRRNNRLFIVPQLTTLYKHRNHQLPKMAECVSRIIALQKVNTFVFCPSFEYMQALVKVCQFDPGTQVFVQSRGMNRDETAELLAHFQRKSSTFDASNEDDRNDVFFGVTGGSFSEGIDLPGTALESVIVLGPALPKVSLEQQLLQKYLARNGEDGFDLGAVIPAMVKVNQALGRLIRTETDKGTGFLLDFRFCQSAYYERLSKEWKSDTPHELVSSKLAEDITKFWNQANEASG